MVMWNLDGNIQIADQASDDGRLKKNTEFAPSFLANVQRTTSIQLNNDER